MRREDKSLSCHSSPRALSCNCLPSPIPATDWPHGPGQWVNKWCQWSSSNTIQFVMFVTSTYNWECLRLEVVIIISFSFCHWRIWLATLRLRSLLNCTCFHWSRAFKLPHRLSEDMTKSKCYLTWLWFQMKKQTNKRYAFPKMSDWKFPQLH